MNVICNTILFLISFLLQPSHNIHSNLLPILNNSSLNLNSSSDSSIMLSFFFLYFSSNSAKWFSILFIFTTDVIFYYFQCLGCFVSFDDSVVLIDKSFLLIKLFNALYDLFINSSMSVDAVNVSVNFVPRNNFLLWWCITRNLFWLDLR